MSRWTCTLQEKDRVTSKIYYKEDSTPFELLESPNLA